MIWFSWLQLIVYSTARDCNGLVTTPTPTTSASVAGKTVDDDEDDDAWELIAFRSIAPHTVPDGISRTCIRCVCVLALVAAVRRRKSEKEMKKISAIDHYSLKPSTSFFAWSPDAVFFVVVCIRRLLHLVLHAGHEYSGTTHATCFSSSTSCIWSNLSSSMFLCSVSLSLLILHLQLMVFHDALLNYNDI